MKIFLDTAHFLSIEKGHETGLIDGVTTNPTHLSKESGDIVMLLKKICKLMEPDDVSIEITENEPAAVYKQAREIAALASNVIVKIPCALEFTPVIKQLVKEGVAINITLLFSVNQGLLMSKLGVKYISPFIGRLDDIDAEGITVIQDLKKVFENYYCSTQILAASLRSTIHVTEVALAGADVATIPVPLFESLLNHPLTDRGRKLFDNDWKKLGIKKFP